jgi:hypothetical protein
MGGFFPELAAKRLELLKETVSGLSRVAVLWNAANPIKHLDWKATQAAGRALALTLRSFEVRSGDDFPIVFDSIRKGRSEAFFLLEDPMMFRHRAMIVAFAAREHLPAIYDLDRFLQGFLPLSRTWALEAKLLELPEEIARAEPENQPGRAHAVDVRAHPRQQARLALADATHQRPEADRGCG